MGDINDVFDSPLGLTVALIKRHKQKKELKQIELNNIEAQGIVNYKPSNIEAFFDDSEFIGNIIISGGNDAIRARAVARNVECAYGQGFLPIVLHCGNYNLENYLLTCFGTQNVSYLNSQSPYYEPFIGLTDSEISHIIMNSTTENYEIKSNGKYYLDGITSFIRSKKIAPYLWMYITCPHMELNDKVNEAQNNGLISEDVARRIVSLIVQGELERGSIENYFSELKNEAEYIIAKKNNLGNAINIKQSAGAHKAIVVDLRNPSNSILLNILLTEIELLKSRGHKIFLCIDGFRITENKMLEKYVKTSGGQSVVCMAGSDVYTDFSGDDNLFFSVAGRTSKIVLLKHMSAFSCQKFSEIVGTYDKKEVNDTYTSNTNLIGRFSYGATSSKNISVKRESIIKPEIISRLREDEVYILDNNNGELAHTTVV